MACIWIILGALVTSLIGLAPQAALAQAKPPPANVRIATAGVAVVAAPDALAVLRRARTSLAGLRRPPAWFVAWLLALSPGLVFALLSALTPTIDPDGVGYHLTVPKRWLAMGSLGYLPTYPYSNTPMGTEMLFTIGFGKGRVFHTTLGHDPTALKCVGFIATYQRGCEWAATGKVTQKVPADFPTADKVSSRP